MISKVNRILQKVDASSVLRATVLCCALLFVLFPELNGQVISNKSAVISVTAGAVVVSKDAENTAAGTVSNNGTVDLSGSYISTAFTNGNGLFRIGKDWINSGAPLTGLNTVNFNGSVNQLIQRAGGETFYNLTISNSGAPLGQKVSIANNVTISGTLSMETGNVDAAAFKLFLSNGAASALQHIGEQNRSKIFGKFERNINQAGTYLFPLGTQNFYNPANIKTNNLPGAGSLVSEFITAAPGDAGLPLPDAPVEIFKTYPDAFWRFTSNGFSSSDFSVDLTGNGFTDTIFDVTRIVKRTGTTNWIVDGTHTDGLDSVVYRNNLTTNFSAPGTDFALAHIRPIILSHPRDTIVCENTNPVFRIVSTGTLPLTYIWYKDGVAITSGPHYSGNRSNTLTILNVTLADAGTYYCVVRDRDRNITQSNPATLTVNKIPVATITNQIQAHECSAVAFDNMILGETYGVPLTTYYWSRNNAPGIITTVPLTGASLNIGDALSGSFTNITDAPIEIIFTITPVGPAPTFCEGIPIEAHITVNPTPRVIPENGKPEICYGGLTQIKLTSPSIMTTGVIMFDYNITVTAPPAVVAGNRTSASDVPLNSLLSFAYTNESDTLQSVYYNVTPKVVGLACPVGVIVSPEVKVHARPLQNLIITQPLLCNGGSNASLRGVTSEGAGAYYFEWRRGISAEIINGWNIPDLVNKKGGRWDLAVTDNLGCKNSRFIYVEGAFLVSDIRVIDSTGYGTTCPGSNDGEIWVKEDIASTGIPPFEYWVVRNQDTVIHNILPATNVTQKYTGLMPGNYKLYLKDNNHCFDNPPPEVNIIEPDIITPFLDKFEYPGGHNVSCKDYNDGSIVIDTVTGGNGGYKFKWTTVDGLITGPDSLDRLENIPAGTYSLTTTDRKNCSSTVNITLTEPEGMDLTGYTLTNISCNGGSDGRIDINITGGSGNYIYTWSGPDGFSSTVNNISGLKAGTYSVLVTDRNNSACSILPQPLFTLTEPPVLTVSSVPSMATDGIHNINCNGGTGTININAAGGTGGTYHYSWSTPDGSGILSGNEDQFSLGAGTYTVVVSDSNNCTATVSTTLTEPAALQSQVIPTHISCMTGSFDNGSIELTVSGGSAPYTYLWSNGATTANISGLTAGDYTVTVSDVNGCQITDGTTISLPVPLTYTRTVSDYLGYNVSCYGMTNGYININMTGGTAPYIYTWTGPNGFSSTSKDIANLASGTYNLTIVDRLGCSVNENIELTDPGQFGMDVSLSQPGGGFNISCAGGRDGIIDIEPVNQVGSVEYLWSDGIFGKTRADLPSGEYKVIITDENNCYAASTIILTEPDTIKIDFEISKPFCPDMPDGAIQLNVTGGVMGTDYLYRWSDNSTGKNLTNIPRGHYRVTVTDMNGCSARDSVFVESMNETCLVIPNAISPNNDGINDVWNIGMTELYPAMEVKVFNRWGEAIWRSGKGYPHPWDGTFDGAPLPIDSYHYTIDLHNGSRIVVGNITILK